MSQTEEKHMGFGNEGLYFEDTFISGAVYPLASYDCFLAPIPSEDQSCLARCNPYLDLAKLPLVVMFQSMEN